ncbi:MAG: ROK family protein [Lachnospiraceae bacterium]|nr:ROK family protein [Lachnospiraceae bacterium]
MIFKNIELAVKHIPPLDNDFIAIAAFNREYLKLAYEPLAIAIERENSQRFVYDTKIINDGNHDSADEFYIERLVKLLLWAVGGFRITICGNEKIAGFIKSIYNTGGKREFDADFMSNVYESKFEVVNLAYEEKPESSETPVSLSRDLSGCRIGFDAGGSDRKVSAVIDGEAVYSEETIWHPKITADPDYHYNEIVTALKTAAAKMPRVDAIGISSAGIYVNNRTMVASLFRQVQADDFQRVVKNIYLNAAKEIGDVPVVVANDGDVSALAGAMSLNDTNILGIAMGTSLAAGYIDKNGNITGRLNELAFAPVDGKENGAWDEWSGDLGCGVKYISQDAVALLAPYAGITLPSAATPAEKLKFVQDLPIEKTAGIYESIGCYLGHALALWRDIYDLHHVLLLGRVMSGAGGDLIIATAEAVLCDDYPGIKGINLHLPDEKNRRVGQSVAAAALPRVR